jgi:hypothetical protein
MNQAAASTANGPDGPRRSPRIDFRVTAEAVIYPAREGKGRMARCLVLTQDLSGQGCNIVHPVPLAEGQRLDILIDGKTPRPAVVAWCRPLPDKLYSIGCRFTD